jgi:glycosyltransferase involved in cell wall biosynthesis
MEDSHQAQDRGNLAARVLPSRDVHLAAVGTRDPFHPRTFSGYSKRLFDGIATRGVPMSPVATAEVRWHDLVRGAINVRGLAHGRFSGRYAPRINPAWFWSRTGYDRSNRRFEVALRNLPDVTHLLQVGTHVRATRPDTQSFCVTDCTIVQAVAAGEFAVSQMPDRLVQEAIECQREVFASCEKVFLLSQWAADSVVRDYGIPADRVAVVGAGPNVRPVPPAARVASDPYVLFVGFDWEQKGGPLLLEACRLLWREGERFRLVVVGCSPRIDGEFVEVVGPLDTTRASERDRLYELFAGARCLALLSAFETLGMVILEAGLMGVPTVSTRHGSRSEVIVDGTTGVLVDDRTPSAVAGALRLLVRDEVLASTMGAAARAHVEATFTWPSVVDRVLSDMGVGT